MRLRRIHIGNSSQTMLLDAYSAETFVIWLRGNVASLTVKNITAGRLYVFILKMDAIGGHRFSWGGQIQNASPINSTPNSVTVQCFIGNSGGILMADAPASWA